MKRSILLVLFFIAISTAVAAQNRPAGSPGAVVVAGSRDASQIRRETFEIVWQTIKEKHFDPALGGVDWDKVREQYRPRVEAATTDQELHTLLQQMLGELKQSHFNIIPPEAVPEDFSSEPQTGGVGLDLRFIEGQAVITRIEKESAASLAGLRQGFVITQVGDTPVKAIVERFSNGRYSPLMLRLYITRAILARINGTPGSQVRVTYQGEGDRVQVATLVRARFKGEMSPPFGNFPSQYTEFESRRLAGGIGYIRFNIFVAPVMPKIRQAIREMSDASGLIFDLRGNPGGFGGMSSGIAGLLETKQISLGTMRMRTASQNFAIIPQANPYLGPVIIIIDGLSGSTSEIFAAGMQENGRAVVVGERSMGAALPSVFQKLPTGARFQYAIADFRTPKGVLIEGRGVIPTVEVKLTKDLLLKGGDAQLEAAIEQVKKLSAAQVPKAVGF